jgi:enoyl-[acyl-carrier-protein] reductase (NADH)
MSGVLLPYRIWQRSVFSDYNDMADNKAYLESVARSFGYFWKGQKVRVNTISNHQRLQRQVKLLRFNGLLHLLIKWHR